jgi:hypothetical protein
MLDQVHGADLEVPRIPREDRSPRKNSSATNTTEGMNMDLDDTERELAAR